MRGNFVHAKTRKNMKKTLINFSFISLLLLTSVFINSCTEEEPCYYNGNELFEGSEGGCYYINSNDNKTYVDRSYCNCN